MGDAAADDLGNGAALRFHIGLAHHAWGVGKDPAIAAEGTLALAREADSTAIDTLWVSEDPDGWDAYALLGALAREVSRVRIGPAVVNPFGRHPNLIAASVATLDRLAPGRTVLGLGRGQPEWYRHGLGVAADAPLASLKATLELLGQWRTAPHVGTSEAGADAADAALHVRGWERSVVQARDVPVYLAAVGPKALALAGERADGVLFNDLASETWLREAIGTVRTAAVKAGRDPGRIDFAARVPVRITGDPEAEWNRRKATVAMIIALPGMERLIAVPGFDTTRIIADVRQAMGTEDALKQGGGFAALRRGGNLELAKSLIPDALMQRLVAAGNLVDVRSRLAVLRDAGVTSVVLDSGVAEPGGLGDALAGLRG